MASLAPLIPDYQQRISDVLESLGLRAPAATKVFDKIEALRTSGQHVHPTYNFKVFRGNEPLFFRALVRNDTSLRRMRSRTVDVLAQIGDQLARKRKPAFEVPRVIEAGRSGPLVWDLETLVEGSHLRSSWSRPSQLSSQLNEARKQVRAFEAVAALDLDLDEENWARQRRNAARFSKWASTHPDFDPGVIADVDQLQREYFADPGAERCVVHGDWWQGNVLTRPGKVPVILDWDEVHAGSPGEMFGRHWTLMCSEPRWQEVVVKAIGRKDAGFWAAFHAYAWARAIDQVNFELTKFWGRTFESHDALAEHSPTHARVVDQMLKAMNVLARNIGGPPPMPGYTGPRRR